MKASIAACLALCGFLAVSPMAGAQSEKECRERGEILCSQKAKDIHRANKERLDKAMERNRQIDAGKGPKGKSGPSRTRGV